MISLNNDTLILIDGSSYLYRAFHALPTLTNAQGLPTGAVYGVTNMLKSLLANYQPQYAAVVFDTQGPTFREKLYPEYKANRSKTPDELIRQIPFIHEIVEALGFPLLMEQGVEADDVIGTLTQQAEALGWSVLIFTGDKDFAQLVSPNVILIDTMKNSRLDVQGVNEKFGVSPAAIVDYLCLIGDSVDNVPGVPKVGPKTAVKWLTIYGSLEQLIDQAEQITGKVGENLRQAIPNLDLTRQLLTIRCDISLPYHPNQLQLKPQSVEKLHQLWTQLEFKKWLAELSVENVPLLADNAAQENKQYDLVLTQAAFENWLERLKAAPLFAFDTETTSLDYLQAEIVGVSFALQAGEAAYVPVAHDYLGAPEQLARDNVLAALKPLLEDPNRLKVGHHLKYDAHVLANHGIQLQGIAFDTLLESYLIDSTTAQRDLDSLALRHLQLQTIHFEDIAGKGKRQLTFNQIDLKQAAPYAAEDAEITWQLHQQFYPQLQALPKVHQLFTDLEMPLVPVLMRIERHGVKIDTAQLHQQSTELANRLQQIEQQVYELAGTEFNLNSPKQLQMVLFERLKLPILKKTPKKEPSTAVEVLEELALNYPLPRLILEYRSLSKLKSTYTDTLPQQIHPKTGRIHTSYHQAVTVTGRLSSSRPNLQNIPIRTEEGRRIRRAFIAPQGYQLLAADYSQIELRIMAHLSEDQGLLTAFASGQDVHRHTASEVFEVPIEAVTSEQRRKAKAINFGLIYGMQVFGLAQQLGIERQEAQKYMDAYFARYPQVQTFMTQMRELAKEQGFVETVFGRRLYIPEIRSSHHQRRQYAERSAINAPMQGTAADLIKMAMLRIDQWIQHRQLAIQMIMQVHDELVFQVADNKVEEAKAAIIEAMSQVAQLKVPLLVEVGIGQNWEEAH